MVIGFSLLASGLSTFVSDHPTSTSRNITESQSRPPRNHSTGLPTPIPDPRSTPERPQGYISLPVITWHYSYIQGNQNHAKTEEGRIETSRSIRGGNHKQSKIVINHQQPPYSHTDSSNNHINHSINSNNNNNNKTDPRVET